MDDENTATESGAESPLGQPASPADPRKESEQALEKAIVDSNEVLVTAATLGPVHRGRLTLSRSKLYGEQRLGIRNVSVMSVRVEDVLNANGEVGPISGFIHIATKFTSPGEPYHIGPFHRKDVLRLKRIIQGYVIALQKGIDPNPIPTRELISMLYEIGDDDPSIK
jgi:hypothetical protein